LTTNELAVTERFISKFIADGQLRAVMGGAVAQGHRLRHL